MPDPTEGTPLVSTHLPTLHTHTTNLRTHRQRTGVPLSCSMSFRTRQVRFGTHISHTLGPIQQIKDTDQVSDPTVEMYSHDIKRGSEGKESFRKVPG